MKRKSDPVPPNTFQMQSALIKTLDLLGEDAMDLLISYLYRNHSISIGDPKSFSGRKLESALEELFGAGADILMRKFNAEAKRPGTSSAKFVFE